MSGFLRPEAIATLHRWREVIIAAAALVLGTLLLFQVGYVLKGIGLVAVLASASYVILAIRRVRFAGASDGPGVVTIDEGQIAYFAPQIGGTIDRAALTELRLRNTDGIFSWFLVSETHALAIPHDAAGADQLFDMFSALPGLSTVTLLEALGSSTRGSITVWRRDNRPVLTALR